MGIEQFKYLNQMMLKKMPKVSANHLTRYRQGTVLGLSSHGYVFSYFERATLLGGLFVCLLLKQLKESCKKYITQCYYMNQPSDEVDFI